jgi:hypothetical protein
MARALADERGKILLDSPPGDVPIEFIVGRRLGLRVDR